MMQQVEHTGRAHRRHEWLDRAERRARQERQERRDCTIPPLAVGANAKVPSAGATATDPLTIITSLTPAFFFSADAGVVQSSNLVSQWTDQSVGGNNAIQGTGSLKPTYLASDPNFGGRGSVTGDGVDDTMTMTWNPPLPGTTSIWFLLVLNQISWVSGGYVISGGNQILSIAQSVSSPILRQFNTTGANGNDGLAVGVSGRVAALFNNATTGYIKCGSKTVTGTNAGNSDAASFNLFSRNTGITPSHVSISCAGAWLGAGGPTPTELTNIDSWLSVWFNGSLSL